MSNPVRDKVSFSEECMNHLTQPVLLLTLSGLIEYANNAARKLLKLPEIDSPLKSISHYFPWLTTSRWNSLKESFIADPDINISYTKSNAALPIGARATMICFEGNKYIMLSLPESENHTILQQSEVYLRTLADNIPEGLVLIFDPTLRVVLSEGKLSLFNKIKEQVEGCLLSEIIDPSCLHEVESICKGALQGEKKVFEFQSANGRWLECSVVPVTSSGHVIGGLVLGFAIDNRKQADEERNAVIQELRNINHQLKIENGIRQLIQKNLQEQTRELELKNQELEQFAYVASHDLQEPLRMVSSYAQLLSNRYSGKLDEDAQEFIGYTIEGAQRMQSLISDLLVYSRVGNKEISFERINLNVILQIVRRNLGLLIDETGATITAGNLPTVHADGSQIVQLFQNLLSNAIKFRKEDEKPHILISAVFRNKRWNISVTDNGIGMSMEYKDRIFQIFQRLHTRDRYPGTGIGLAICKKIMERHNGTITVQSQLGAGTTFTFTLAK